MRSAMAVLPVVLALLLAGGGIADARPANDQFIFVVGRVEDPTATIVANGVVTGTGTLTAESVDFNQPDKSYVETDLAAVDEGTLTVVVHGRFDTWPFTLDPRTCTRSGRITGTWTVVGAGGHLAGAAGGGTLSGRFFTYATRDRNGCDVNEIKGVVAGPMVGDLRLVSPS